MKLKVFAVATLEDPDSIDIFLDQEEAEVVYQAYGEFGVWQERTFVIDDLGTQIDEELT